MEDNILRENSEYKKISKKYPGKFFYNSIKDQINDFKNEYKIKYVKNEDDKNKDDKNKDDKNKDDKNKDISGDTEIIDLSDQNGKGDEMLKKLFLIIAYKTKNKIKKLILRNNKIKDPSILSRIHFSKLQTLDLSINEIANIDFLSVMQAENLKYLYLDNNNLNTIYPILNANFPDLQLLSLNDNYFNIDKIQKSLEYAELMKKNTEEKKLEIQFKHNNDVCDQAQNGKKISSNDNNKSGSNVLNKSSKTIKSQ